MIRQQFLRPALPLLALGCIAGLVAWLYFPVFHAGFVWDDRIFLHDDASLRVGGGWLRGIFGIFFGEPNYFRPMAAALLVGEMRAFDTSAAAMHMVSVGLHVANVFLVGVAARRMGALFPAGANRPGTYAAMLVYGLHPLMIEPVAWIACQVELLVTMFVLLGLVSHLSIRNLWLRAGAVSGCFFLAACSKEAAIAFPLLLVVVDWQRYGGLGRRERAECLARQAVVYCAIAVAGGAYLLLRRWGLGHLLAPSSLDALGAWPRFQLVCETYLTYWRVMVWPMDAIDPLHESARQFSRLSFESAAIDIGALALFGFGAYQLAKRRAVGCLIMSTSVLLLPVMHILPVEIDQSRYHDRWLMGAVAIACAVLPATYAAISARATGWRRQPLFVAAAVAIWLLVAAFNVRVTVPLWSSETRLWQWAVLYNPNSEIAKNNLLAIYIEEGDLARARPIARSFLAKGTSCLNCLLNATQVALLDHDGKTADRAIEATQKAIALLPATTRQWVNYVAKVGDVRRLHGDLAGAEAAYRDAVQLDPMIPTPHLSLATVLAKQGKIAEARRAADDGFALVAPDLRARQRQEFEEFLRQIPASAGR